MHCHITTAQQVRYHYYSLRAGSPHTLGAQAALAMARHHAQRNATLGISPTAQLAMWQAHGDRTAHAARLRRALGLHRGPAHSAKWRAYMLRATLRTLANHPNWHY